MALLAGPVSAQEGIFGGMQKGVESVFTTMSTTTTLASGAVTKTETTSISPSLYLNLDALVYPNLRLNAGGVWELSMLNSRTGGLEVDSTITRSRPFFLLRSTNPVLSPGFGYSRREDRARVSSVSDIKLVNDEYAAYLGWNPSGGPTSEFQFVRTHTFDGDRTFEDVTKGFGSLVSNYAYRNLGASYRGAYLDTDNRIEGVDTRQVSHAGRLTYADTFFNKRLAWNAAYNVNYQGVRTVATSPDGEVAIPLNPLAGLAALSDTPVTAKLSQNGQLIDGNLTASAGVDLGVTAPTEDPQSRNIGLDFLTLAEVNRLLIWVDRDLPFDIARSFSWEIYSSSGQRDLEAGNRRVGGALRPVREPLRDRFPGRLGPFRQGGHAAPVRRRAGRVALPRHLRHRGAGVPQAAGWRDQQPAGEAPPTWSIPTCGCGFSTRRRCSTKASTCTMGRTRTAGARTRCRTAYRRRTRSPACSRPTRGTHASRARRPRGTSRATCRTRP